jgi:hypothetical protein
MWILLLVIELYQLWESGVKRVPSWLLNIQTRTVINEESLRAVREA